MINKETHQYVHIHTSPNTLEFIPFALSKPIKPGMHRVFAVFYPDGKRISTDFTVRIGE